MSQKPNEIRRVCHSTIPVNSTRYPFIDLLRVVACFLVIVNHTNSRIFLNTEPSLTWYASITYFFICKIAVPIFVMISGYTMLDRIDSYKKIGLKLLRTLSALGVFSLLYYCISWQSGNKPNAGIKDFLLSVFQTPQTNAFWYLYLYIGILIMLPFLQKMVVNLSKKDIELFIIISLFFISTCPIIEHFIPSLRYCRHMELPLFNGYICLLLIGYYFKKYVIPDNKKLIISIVTFIISIAFNVIMTHHEYEITEGTKYLFFDNRLYLPIILASISFFYMASHLKISGVWVTTLSILGSCSFGIYLISDFLIAKLIWIWNDLCANGIHPIIAIILFEIIIFVAGFIITFILKKIPVIKKIL